MATVLGLMPPFVGAVIYMLFRPPEYLDEVRERELEMKALQAMRPTEERCPSAAPRSRPASSSAPSARRGSASRACGCKAPLDRLWQVCPFCETPVPSRRRRIADRSSRRSASDLEAAASGRRRGGERRAAE